jgi:ABC-type nitrate/sulfonate/bicarbonate transport system permease component
MDGDDPTEDFTKPPQKPPRFSGVAPPAVPPPVPPPDRRTGVGAATFSAIDSPASVKRQDAAELGDASAEATIISAGPESVFDSAAEPVPMDLASLYGPPPTEPESDPLPRAPVVDRTVRESSPLAAVLGGAFGAAVLGALWWFLTNGDGSLIDDDVLGSPRETWDVFRDISNDDVFRENIAATMKHFGFALAAGLGAGAVVGGAAGSSEFSHALMRPFLSLFRLLSPVLLIAVAFRQWGIDGATVWVPAAVATFSAFAWSTAAAMSDSRRGMSKNQAERLIAGLRAALPLTWALIYAAEFSASTEGIGRNIFQGLTDPSAPSSAATMTLYLIVALLLALLVDVTLRVLQHSVRDH